MIETINLSRRFGDIKAVDDLSFKVEPGEVLGFLGPNGAGKSTTMKMITTFLAPTAGTIRVMDHDVIEDPMEVRKAIGYLPETAPAYGEMSVFAFLTFVARIRGFSGPEATKAVDKVLRKCSLESVKFQNFETLSKGYKRRVGLAQAIIHDPPVLIMDEPTDGLDPNQKYEVRELISRMSKDRTIILSTHILEEVDAVCSRAVIIAGGRLVADGTPEDLKRQSRSYGAVSIRIRTDNGAELQGELEKVPHVEKVTPSHRSEEGIKAFDVLPMRDKSVAAGITELAREKKWDVAQFAVDPGRLDEVFRQLTTGDKAEAKGKKGEKSE